MTLPQPSGRNRLSATVAAADVATLWSQYRRTRSEALRNRLIEAHLPLVETAARRLAARIGRAVRPEDLLAAGVFGLIDAIESFDHHRRVRFSTFSSMRIRGAMLDELRAMDPAPRRVRGRARQIGAAAQSLRGEIGRPATETELAERLGLDPAQYFRWARDARLASVRSLDADSRSPENGSDRSTMIPADPSSLDPLREAQRRMLREVVTRGLSRAERLIVTLHFYEDLTLREIGEVLDLSESRISQMLKKIKRRLRHTLGESCPGFREELSAA